MMANRRVPWTAGQCRPGLVSGGAMLYTWTYSWYEIDCGLSVFRFCHVRGSHSSTDSCGLWFQRLALPEHAFRFIGASGLLGRGRFAHGRRGPVGSRRTAGRCCSHFAAGAYAVRRIDLERPLLTYRPQCSASSIILCSYLVLTDLLVTTVQLRSNGTGHYGARYRRCSCKPTSEGPRT